MSPGITNSIDMSSFTSSNTSMVYPYLYLEGINGTTPLVVSLLEKGELQVLATYKDSTKVIANISYSPYNIDLLLKTVEAVIVCKSSNEKIHIKSVFDYMEVMY